MKSMVSCKYKIRKEGSSIIDKEVHLYFKETEPIEEEEEAITNMRGSSDSTNLELLDPSIMADRETSMHVTTW